MKEFVNLIIIFWWMAGFILVKGAWLSVLAIVFPPYPMYLFVESVLKASGMLL